MSKKIERAIELPESEGRIRKYPYPDMKVGDSFIMFKKYNRANVQKASASYCNYSRMYTGGEWKFTQRKTEEGIRVWRIK